MALLNLLLLPILAALGLFDASGESGSAGTSGGAATGTATGGDGGGTPAQQGAGATGGASGAAGAPPAAAGGQEPPKPQQGTSLEDVAKLQRELNEARQQAGQYRAAGIQAIASALGIELPKAKGEEGQDAQLGALQKEINDLRTESRENAITAAFERTATKLSVKPVLTRKYVADQLRELDPKADDFTTKLEQIVQAAVDEEPALKAAQAASRSGGEFNNGNGNQSSDEASMSIDDLRKEFAKSHADR